MLFNKLKICPSCQRKVEKSKLMIIETEIGTKVTCCDNCITYLKIRRKIS